MTGKNQTFRPPPKLVSAPCGSAAKTLHCSVVGQAARAACYFTTPTPHFTPACAELSNKPAVTAVTGYDDRAVLMVLRPETLANVTALSYKVMRY